MTASMQTGPAAQACGSCHPGGSPSSGGCASGGCSPAPAVADGGSFLRPRFFSGQLLTEDDLVQLTDYVSAKNRLHNRFLFGEGVVSGLEVACGPCGNGSVVVSPGYALDGCGNDIVVPVAHTLDVPRMVLDLRRRTLGVDCPDPAGTPKGEHIYRLLVRYLEQPCEPVLPYTTDDACASQVCELSRIREGYSFELEYVQPWDEKQGFERVFADRLDSVKLVALLETLSQLAANAKNLQSMLGAMIAPPHEASASPLQDAHVAAAKAAAKEEPPADETFPDKVRRLLRYASLVTRYDQRLDRQQVVAEIEMLRARILGDKGPAGLANEVLQSAELSKLSAADRASVTRLAQIAQRWCQPNLPREEYQAPEPRALASGVVFDSALAGDTRQQLALIRDQLGNAAALAGTDGVLRTDIAAVDLSGDLGVAVDALKTMALRLVRDFLFGALLPSASADSGQSAVELACITVKNGVVVQVRSLARRFVAAPASLRFWRSEPVSPLAALPTSSALAGWVKSATCQSLPAVDLGQFDQILRELPAEERASSSRGVASAGRGGAGGSSPPSTPVSARTPASQASNPVKPSASMTPPPLGSSSQRRESPAPGQSPGTGPVPGPLSGGRRG